MRSLLALAALAAASAEHLPYDVRVERVINTVESGVSVPKPDVWNAPHNEDNKHPLVITETDAGASVMYFCGAFARGDTGVLRLDLDDPAAVAEVQYTFGYRSDYAINCNGLTHDASNGVLLFAADTGSGGRQFYSCDLDTDGYVTTCTDIGNAAAGNSGMDSLAMQQFQLMPNGDIIGSGVLSGGSAPTYSNTLMCINRATNTVVPIDVNGNLANADATFLTAAGASLLFTGMLPVPNQSGARRGIGMLTKSGADACSYTVSTVMQPPNANWQARDGFIARDLAPNGHVIVKWWNTDFSRYSFQSVDVSTGTAYPIWIPTYEEAPGNFDVGFMYFGSGGDYFFFTGAYLTAEGSARSGLFAAKWDSATSTWDRRIISDRSDEDADKYNGNSANGLAGNLMYLDEDAGVLVLTGLDSVGKAMGVDVSSLLDGSLARGETLALGERVPPMFEVLERTYDASSWVKNYNVAAGDWAFMIGDAYDSTPDACTNSPTPGIGYNVVTGASVRVIPEYESVYELGALKVEGMNAIILYFGAGNCDDGRDYAGFRVLDATTLETIGSIKTDPADSTVTDASDTSTVPSNLVQLSGKVYFGWDVNSNLYSFTLPTEDTRAAWATALEATITPMFEPGTDAVHYYTSNTQAYPMITTAWGKVWFSSYSTGCLTSYDPVGASFSTYTFVLKAADPVAGTDEITGCMDGFEVPTRITIAGQDALIMSANQAGLGAEAWVVYDQATKVRRITDAGGWWSAFFHFDSATETVYFLSTTQQNSDALMKWDGTTEMATLVYDGNAESWSAWGPYPGFVKDYYGAGKPAIAVLTKTPEYQESYSFSEPASNYRMINVMEPEISAFLPRNADFWLSPSDLSDSADQFNNFFTVAGSAVVFGSSSQAHGIEPYKYDPAVDTAPVLAINILDTDWDWYSAGSITLSGKMNGEHPMAFLSSSQNGNLNGLFEVTLGYLPPSASPSPSTTPSASATPTPSTSFSNTPSPSVTPTSSPSASVTPSPSASASTPSTPTAAPSTEAAASATPSSSGAPPAPASASPTPSASSVPKAKVELKLTVPAVTKADLTANGAGTNLRNFVAAKASLPVAAVRIIALVYYNTTTRTVLLTINVPANDPINTAQSRLRRLQNEPSGPDVSLELAVEVLAPTQQDANNAASAISSILADPTALSSDPSFSSFQTALCSAADCSNGVVLQSAVQVTSLTAPPAAKEDDDKVGPGVGGFFGAAAGLLLIAGLYYYLYYKPAKAAKAASVSAAAQPGGTKLVVRQVNPVEGHSTKASFAPASTAV